MRRGRRGLRNVVGYDDRVEEGLVEPTNPESDVAYVSRPFVLYWSSLEKFEQCPRKFFWYRGWGDIDLGRGPGRGKPLPVKRSEHHALMGDVIQRVIEELYNEQIWSKYKGKELRQHLDELTAETLERKLGRRHVEWGGRWDQAGSRTELLEICLAGVRGYLKTMKHNRLLGVYAQCEVELGGVLDGDIPIAGRADLVLRRENGREVNPGVSILDGKNSKHKGRYTYPDQCRWYALCLFLEIGALPDRVGFVYYRYPYGTPIEGSEEVESGIDWVAFTMEDVEGLAERAREARRKMDAQEFDPDPSPSNCKYCDFETVCDARIAQKKSRKRKPKKKKEGSLADLVEKGGGIVDIG